MRSSGRCALRMPMSRPGRCTRKSETVLMTRRTFLGTATAALTVSASAAAKLNLGIGSYTYHSLSIDDMITRLKRLEIHEIEMSHGPFMLFSHPGPEKFEAARSS